MQFRVGTKFNPAVCGVGGGVGLWRSGLGCRPVSGQMGIR